MTVRWANLLLLCAICFLCFFCRLGSVGLLDSNEAIYTQVAREMYLRKDFVTPTINAVPWFDKPPLALWLAAASFAVFGVNELAARLPVAIAASALVLLTYGFGARFFGERAGFLAGAALALNPIFLGTARLMTMDIHQSLWFAVALLCFFAGYRAKTPGGKRWYYGLWASCGLSFLAKSFPGILPLFVALAFVVLDQRFRMDAIARRVWEARPLLGIPILLAVVLPWHVLISRANGPLFAQEYFWHHNVQILNGKDFNHGAPVWYYIPALLLSLYPWSVFLAPALWRTIVLLRRHPGPLTNGEYQDGDLRRARLLVLTWFVVIFVMFSGMVSKLVSYLLPLYPAAALLIGDWLDQELRQGAGRWLRVCLGIIAGMAVTAASAVLWALHRYAGTDTARRLYEAVPQPVVTAVAAGLVLLAAGTVAAALLGAIGRRYAGTMALVAACSAFVLLCVTKGITAIQATMTGPLERTALIVGSMLKPGTAAAISIPGPGHPSLLFYLPGWIYLGSRLPFHSAGRVPFLADAEETIAYLRAHSRALVITDRSRAAEVRRGFPSAIQITGSGRYVVLATLDVATRKGGEPGEPSRNGDGLRKEL
ncbi:MAG: glycosyltransferase family 39 protein [Chthonomonadales bacterium]